MGLREDLERIAAAAAAFSSPGERVSAVLAAQPATDGRAYLCSFEDAEERRSWLVVGADGVPVEERASVRETVSIAALCEIAAETAGGGHLDELRQQIVTLRITENPPGLDEAQAAIDALEAAIGPEPRLAAPAYLDEVGAATRRLERALGEVAGPSPFAAAMQAALGIVDELAAEVLAGYKGALRP